MDQPAVRIHEVSPRDGLQNESEIVPTELKVRLIASLVDAGFRDIEVTSFVRPRWIPQLADATDVVRQLPDRADVRYWALIPNQVGMERALDAGIQHIATFMSASETHNAKNLNRTIRESLADVRKVIQMAVSEHAGVRSYISTVFGCPYEGRVPESNTVEIAGNLLEAGADVVVLGDTTGMANPRLIETTLETLYEAGIRSEQIALHLHDTRGTALANALAGLGAGIRTFDGSIAGIGGCPYAPGAAGNLATEDLIYMLHEMGFPTGIDLDAACVAGQQMSQVLGRELPGRFQRYWAGLRPGMQARSA